MDIIKNKIAIIENRIKQYLKYMITDVLGINSFEKSKNT
jgi:hypothetical protein